MDARIRCYIPRSVAGLCPADVHSPAEDTLQVPGAAGEPVAQLLQELLFTQAVHDRRDALRQAEEGEDDHGRELLGPLLDELPFVQHRQHEVHKVREEEHRELAAVQGDRPAAGPVAPVQHPQPAALHQDPHVAVQDEQRAHADEQHLLQLAFPQLLPAALAVIVVPSGLEQQAERDAQRHQPGEHAQQPGPVPRRAARRVAHRVAHGAVAVQRHHRERQEDVGAAADQDGDHGEAGGALRPRALVDLVVEDAARAQVDQGGQQQVEDEHEARVAPEVLHADDGGVDDEVEEEQHREGHGGDVEAHAGVVPRLRRRRGRGVVPGHSRSSSAGRGGVYGALVKMKMKMKMKVKVTVELVGERTRQPHGPPSLLPH